MYVKQWKPPVMYLVQWKRRSTTAMGKTRPPRPGYGPAVVGGIAGHIGRTPQPHLGHDHVVVEVSARWARLPRGMGSQVGRLRAS
jgi:hypothetical protein